MRPFNLDCGGANFVAHVRAVLAEEAGKALAKARKRWSEAAAQDASREEAVQGHLTALAGEEEQLLRLLDNEATLGSFDLVDVNGERKFVGNKLDQRLSTLFAGDRLFFFVRVVDRADPKSLLQPLYLSPAALLSPEETVAPPLPRAVEQLRGRAKKLVAER